MSVSVLIILIHQAVFQGMFLAKNISLHRKLGQPVRGHNPEANLSIVFFAVFIVVSILLGLFKNPVGTLGILTSTTAFALALGLLFVSLLIGAASLIGLRDSWRVGVLEDQETDLIQEGIYRFSRNPYFLSYLLMFAGYTVLLQSMILLFLSLVGCVLIHAMILKEEKYLKVLHGNRYREYKDKVPRYVII